MNKGIVSAADFNKMVRLAPPNSGITAESIAKDLQNKGYELGSGLESYNSSIPKEPKRTVEMQGFLGSIGSYLNAPFDVASGLLNKEASRLSSQVGFSSGEEAGQKVFEENVTPETLKKTATMARVVPSVAAGFATGGASIPISAAITGGVSAFGSLASSGLEYAAGEDKTTAGVALDAGVSGLTDAALDAATRGLFSLAKPLFKAKGAAELGDDLSKTVGRVVQSTDEDIQAAKKALQTIDTTGVNTYEDLAKTIDDKIKVLVAAQDKVLEATPVVKKIKDFTRVVGEGKNTVTVNPVNQAIEGLKELYAKSGAAEDLVRIRSLQQKASSVGITPKEVNDLAREFGRGFKSFSDATGQPLTSINAKLYETIRKGVKNSARDLLPNEASKGIDDLLSDLIPTKDLASDMVDKVRILTNKIEEKGALSSIASKIGGGIDVLLGRTPSSLFTSLLLRGNVGQKTLNSSQIQSALPKNLKTIEYLTKQLENLPEGKIPGKILEITGKALENITSSSLRGVKNSMVNGLPE